MRRQQTKEYYQHLTSRLKLAEHLRESAMKQLKATIQAFHRLESYITNQELEHRLVQGEKEVLERAIRIKAELSDLYILNDENIDYAQTIAVRPPMPTNRRQRKYWYEPILQQRRSQS